MRVRVTWSGMGGFCTFIQAQGGVFAAMARPRQLVLPPDEAVMYDIFRWSGTGQINMTQAEEGSSYRWSSIPPAPLSLLLLLALLIHCAAAPKEGTRFLFLNLLPYAVLGQ